MKKTLVVAEMALREISRRCGVLLLLALLTIVAMQMMLNPDKAAAQALPFWFTREIGTYAVESDAGTDHVSRGLVHAATALAVFLGVVALATTLRLRRRSHVSIA